MAKSHRKLFSQFLELEFKVSPGPGFLWNLWRRTLSSPFLPVVSGQQSIGWQLLLTPISATALTGCMHLFLGPTPLQHDLILTNYMYNDPVLQIRSHSKALGVRTSTYFYGWHNSTHKSHTISTVIPKDLQHGISCPSLSLNFYHPFNTPCLV